MKRKIIYILILLALVFGTFSPLIGADTAYAAEKDEPAFFGTCFKFGITSGGTIDPIGCVAVFSNVFLGIVGRALWVAGIVFDWSLKYTINLNEMLRMMPIVDKGWIIFRDLANVFFIFILLFMSIKTILGLQNWNEKKAIGGIILAAILINFSLFATKLIVDSSNIIALHFYNLIVEAPPGATISDKASGLSDRFMNGLRIQSLYDIKKIDGPVTSQMISQTLSADKAPITMHKVALISIFGAIFILIAAFIFFAAAILFAVRTVVLMFLMMTSPIAFMAFALPSLFGNLSRTWWSMLWSQSFFAPIYLILCYIVVAAINSEAFKTWISQASFSGAFASQDGSSVVIIFNFIFLAIILTYSLVMAKNYGAVGGGMVMKWGQSAQKWGQGAIGGGTFGAMGALGRKTFGRGASNMAESEELKNRASKGGFGGTLAKLQLAGAKKVAGSSFDLRSSGVGKAVGLQNLGKGSGKGGYDAFIKEKTEKEQKIAKSLGPSEDQEKKLKELRENKDLKQKAEREVGEAEKAEKAEMELEKDTSQNEINDAKAKAVATYSTPDPNSAENILIRNQAEQKMKTAKEKLQKAEDGLKKLAEEHKNKVSGKIKATIDEMARTDEELAGALNAEKRKTEYADNIEKRTPTEFLHQRGAVPFARFFSGTNAEEDKKIADKIRKQGAKFKTEGNLEKAYKDMLKAAKEAGVKTEEEEEKPKEEKKDTT